MSMQDAFKYFERMAQLVAQDSVPGAPPPAAAHTTPPGRGLSKLIRVIRARMRVRGVAASVAPLFGGPGPQDGTVGRSAA